MGKERAKTDLLPGMLDMLVLKMLIRGHLHGYAIAQLSDDPWGPADQRGSGRGVYSRPESIPHRSDGCTAIQLNGGWPLR